MLLRKLDNYIQDLLFEKIDINYAALKLLRNDMKVTDTQRHDMWSAYHIVDNWVDGTHLINKFDAHDDSFAMWYTITYYVPKCKAAKFKTRLVNTLSGMGYDWNCVCDVYNVFF